MQKHSKEANGISEDVPCEAKFSEVNAEFAERGLTEKWFDDYVKTFIAPDGRKSLCYDSAPVPVRAKATNRRRIVAATTRG